MKRCGNSRCPLPQPLKPSQFNKNAKGKDGLQNYCRVCQAMSNARIRVKYPDYARMQNKRYRMRYPERWDALRRIRYAVSIHKVKRKPCEVCGNHRVEAFIQAPYEAYCSPWADAPAIRWYCHGHHPNRASADNEITYEEFDDED